MRIPFYAAVFVSSRIRVRCFTDTGALAHEYGCVASQIRVRCFIDTAVRIGFLIKLIVP